jgi:hypothetical protein
MKILIIVFATLIFSVAFNQTVYNFSSLNQSQNKLLDTYGIDYTGPYTRYKVLSGEYLKLNDTTLQTEYLRAFNRFEIWNKNYFKTIPDTVYFSDGLQYMKDKDANELLKATFNETRKILGFYSVKINDRINNVRTIEILELYNTGMDNYIDHIIMVEHFDDFWELITPNDDDITLDCGQCPVP